MAGAVMLARRGRRLRKRLRVVTCRGSSFTVDVSSGGFCTELERVLQVGEPVEGLIHLNGRDASFTGRVAWSRPGDPRWNERGRMGVCFVRIEPEFTHGLEPCVESARGGGTHAARALGTGGANGPCPRLAERHRHDLQTRPTFVRLERSMNAKETHE